MDRHFPVKIVCAQSHRNLECALSASAFYLARLLGPCCSFHTMVWATNKVSFIKTKINVAIVHQHELARVASEACRGRASQLGEIPYFALERFVAGMCIFPNRRA